MKLRTRSRTASGSPRSSKSGAAPEGMVRCELCQRHVPATPEARCMLGHRLPVSAHVGQAPVSAKADPAGAPGAPREPGEPGEPDEVTRPDYLAELGALDAGPAPAMHPDEDGPGHAVDGFLDGSVQQVPAPEPVGTDDPLAWLERFTTPSSVPEPAVPPAAAMHAPFQADASEDIPAVHEAEDPAAASEVAFAEQPAPPEEAEALDDAWSSLRAEEEAAQDARVVRRQRLAVIAGGALFGVMTFGAVALALVA